MAKVGAQRAAELTGRSKSTIQRAMNGGKLSYEVDNNGRRVIDVAELERAFGIMPQETERTGQAVVEAELEKASTMLEIERLKMRVRMLEDQLDIAKETIDDLKEQREQWQKQAQQVLLTSQYSQKQAEELKEEMKERERRAKIRRQQELERRMQGMKGQNENRGSGGAAVRISQEAISAGIQGLWHKIRGDEKEKQATEAVAEGDRPADKVAATG